LRDAEVEALVRSASAAGTCGRLREPSARSGVFDEVGTRRRSARRAARAGTFPRLVRDNTAARTAMPSCWLVEVTARSKRCHGADRREPRGPAPRPTRFLHNFTSNLSSRRDSLLNKMLSTCHGNECRGRREYVVICSTTCPGFSELYPNHEQVPSARDGDGPAALDPGRRFRPLPPGSPGEIPLLTQRLEQGCDLCIRTNATVDGPVELYRKLATNCCIWTRRARIASRRSPFCASPCHGFSPQFSPRRAPPPNSVRLQLVASRCYGDFGTPVCEPIRLSRAVRALSASVVAAECRGRGKTSKINLILRCFDHASITRLPSARGGRALLVVAMARVKSGEEVGRERRVQQLAEGLSDVADQAFCSRWEAFSGSCRRARVVEDPDVEVDISCQLRHAWPDVAAAQR